jgi:hypothetical protein
MLHNSNVHTSHVSELAEYINFILKKKYFCEHLSVQMQMIIYFSAFQLSTSYWLSVALVASLLHCQMLNSSASRTSQLPFLILLWAVFLPVTRSLIATSPIILHAYYRCIPFQHVFRVTNLC